MRILARASEMTIGLAALAALSLSGCGSLSPGAGAGPAGSPAPPASPATAAAARGPAAPRGLAAPAIGPVPAGFVATSVTFTSPGEAYVLGTAPCSRKPCTSIVRTLDRGASWVGVPAPVVPLADPFASPDTSGVWGIRFASPSVGYVFGDGLWETTDGGEHWTMVRGPGGRIFDLEAIDGQLLALTAPCSPSVGCSQTQTLFRTVIGSTSWQAVTQLTNARVIATQARVAAVLDGASVLVTGDGGLTHAVHATPCVSAAGSTATLTAVTGPSSLALLCAGSAAAGSVAKTVYVSNDLGAHWARAGSPPLPGDPLGLSAGTTQRIVVAAASGASWLYSSSDGGAQWSTAFMSTSGGLFFNDLGFTTSEDGVTVFGPAFSDGNVDGQPGQLLLTDNGGATWQATTF